MCVCRYDLHTFFKDKIYVNLFLKEQKVERALRILMENKAPENMKKESCGR